MILKLIYMLFLGILYTALIGFGIDAFYKAPEAPEQPVELRKPYQAPPEEMTEEEREALNKASLKQDEKYKEFEKQRKEHSKTVSVIVLVSALLALTVSLSLIKNLTLFSDGLLLGGVLTLIYSIIRGFEAGDSIFRFIVVAVSFVLAIFVGYIKFIKKQQERSKKSKASD